MTQRNTIALVAGAFPLIVALILMHFTEYTRTFRGTGWVDYLVQHQNEFVQALIMSSVMVAVFFALLGNKIAIFAAGLQPVIIQTMFILADVNQHIVLNLSIAAITVLPLSILSITLRRDIDQIGN